jgi:hypothetical protein
MRKSKTIVRVLFVGIFLGIFFRNSYAQTTVPIPDAGFKARLIKRYAYLLDANQNLIIASAATVTGLMTCNNCNIQSLEGLQYFTSLTEINFPQNNISYIPDISNLKNLTSITLNDNALTYLPDLSKLKSLKNLYAHRNQISYIPDLSANDSLQILYIHSNKLDTLPDLSNLKMLNYLHVLGNNLKAIPGLDSLVSLKTLNFENNIISGLPSLSKLRSLKSLFGRYNSLVNLPAFPSNNVINIVKLDYNKINQLPDFSSFDSLSQFSISSNNLTFQELQKIMVAPNYASIFYYSPQAQLSVGNLISVKVKDTLILRTKTDTLLSGVQYLWYKDTTLVGTVTNDRFVIPQTSFSDSGKYSCTLRYAPLASLSLRTDTFSLVVTPCINVSSLSTLVTPASCDNSATIQVSSNPPLELGATYAVTGSISGKVMDSADGKFSDLTEPAYNLSIISPNGCQTAYPSIINIPLQACNDILITPNNDGNMDSYFFNWKGAIKIYDKRGHLVKNFQGPAEWDGSTDAGKVPVGYYMADINNGESKLGVSVIY